MTTTTYIFGAFRIRTNLFLETNDGNEILFTDGSSVTVDGNFATIRLAFGSTGEITVSRADGEGDTTVVTGTDEGNTGSVMVTGDGRVTGVVAAVNRGTIVYRG